ncbi:hypothetical protein CsSME_00016642 [Camellia sinensis var. sinensis]
MIEVEALYVFCAFHSISSYTLGFFGHHALKCVIDRPRVEDYTPLSFKHDRKGGCAYMALKMHCHALFALCCNKTGFCRKRWPVGHLQCRAAMYCWPRAPLMADDHFPMAGGLSFWPVTFHSAQKVGCNFGPARPGPGPRARKTRPRPKGIRALDRSKQFLNFYFIFSIKFYYFSLKITLGLGWARQTGP